MDLALIKTLKDLFGDRYVSSNELFRKSLNEVAVPAMGSTKATLWIIVDNSKGEDIVRRHYESMLAEDEKITGVPKKIDPYGGPRELVQRLRAQGFNIEMTILPVAHDEKSKYITLKRKVMLNEHHDIQLVCYNLDNIAVVEDEMKVDGVNA